MVQVQLPWQRRRPLPGGVTIGQIGAALEAITTARVIHRTTVRVKGRDVPSLGDGVVDFAHGIVSSRMSVNGGQQVEHLAVGADRFHLLPAGQQQATGKRWVWEKGCSYGYYWAQASAALPRCASCTGSGAEVLDGEPVQRYSFSIRPRNGSFLVKLLGREKDRPVAALYAHLRAHGIARLDLDVWLAGTQAVRQMREHSTALELALLDGQASIVTGMWEYSDFGVAVDLTAPPADEVLGYPGDRGHGA